ncbi:acetyl transferase [Candidatus Sulfuricurvum sp. RIFRC-1]|uniref:NeuD/PglB/VioB family sugar acetyltransferase n=1 Tax=Candidatus Sulfuricurvum sp. RIFRC-1 TaxID=1249480 RepID=UPI0002997306|nr:NeuD/PglB/VioB family sugar acetyltransferase [Candidatus Sulfuricurvum sp. RIFRC-1]AFV98025.1 acetyl transferase [Candidatus Sulfuricurvum sp. RIFRC-1]
MKPKILLIGGGGHCKSVIDVIEMEGSFSIAGIIDQKELVGKKVLGYEVVGCDDDLEELFAGFTHAIITVGQIKSPDVRIKLFNRLKTIGYEIPSIISPKAYVSKHATVDEGTVVMHDALINANATVGKNCIINSKALIEHDSIVGDHCHISTGAILNGGTVVSEGTFFGSNTVSKEYAIIAEKSFIKAGSVVK